MDELWVGVGGLAVAAGGLWVGILTRVDKRLDQYQRKDVQGQINAEIRGDITEIKADVKTLLRLSGRRSDDQ